MPLTVDNIMEIQTYPEKRKLDDMTIYLLRRKDKNLVVALGVWDDVLCRVTTEATDDYEEDVKCLIEKIREQHAALTLKECS